MGPYSASNQLEYLEDQFQIVALKIRASAARMKEDMKRAGTVRTVYSEYSVLT
jgi:hypothetical protein